VKARAVPRSVRQRLSPTRAHGAGNAWPAGCASNGAEDWGVLKERVRQLEKRLARLEALVDRWQQAIVAGLFAVVGYLLVRLVG